MSELEERLNAVLSNPEEMSRLADMAQKLMGGFSGSGAPGAPVTAPPGNGGNGLMGLFSRLTGQSAGQKPLADALAPYLTPERSRRLSRALRIASAARLGMAALSEWGQSDGL